MLDNVGKNLKRKTKETPAYKCMQPCIYILLIISLQFWLSEATTRHCTKHTLSFLFSFIFFFFFGGGGGGGSHQEKLLCHSLGNKWKKNLGR